MATTNDTDLEWRHLIEQLLRVLHNASAVTILVYSRLTTSLGRRVLHQIALLAFLVSPTHIFAILILLLASLQ